METHREDSMTEIRRRMPSESPGNTETSTITAHSRSVVGKAFETFCDVNTASLVQILSIAVTIGSVVYEFRPQDAPPGGSYFSDKRNFFNQYFVKLAWGWTMAIYTPFLVFSGLQSAAKTGQIFKGLVRVLGVGTVVWYCWVEIVFRQVRQVTGVCVGNETLTTAHACIKAGHYWDGFDISGHCFLLIYSALLIHEELRIIRKTVMLSTVPKLARTSQSGQSDATFAAVGYESLVSFFQKLFTVFLVLLELLWIFMVIMTSVYFHAWSHKLIGTLIAFGSWHCTYNMWYINARVFPG